MSDRAFVPRHQPHADKNGRWSMWAFLEDAVAQYQEATPEQREAFLEQARRYADKRPGLLEQIERGP